MPGVDEYRRPGTRPPTRRSLFRRTGKDGGPTRQATALGPMYCDLWRRQHLRDRPVGCLRGRTARANVPVELKFPGQVVAKAITDAAGHFAFGLLPTGKPAATHVIRDGVAGAPLPAGDRRFGRVRSVRDRRSGHAEVQTRSARRDVVRQSVRESPSSRCRIQFALAQHDSHERSRLLARRAPGYRFRAHSVVQLNGRDLATTFNPGNGTLTATVTHLDISRYPGENGTGIIPNQVAVFTAAAPGAGRSANVR